ncbi:hypothetical protein DPMN_005292 [Dreissena polymorpha]|uniref:Uncharacterized protein n=1 Tax=Dreissena polymorpha TaxID=45954 RepID=A0A9D4MUB1_DREPO|nr:hypothetical protein DPMN_005292 [Dreissena polymorpha]
MITDYIPIHAYHFILAGDTDDAEETFEENEDLVDNSDGTHDELAKPHPVKEKSDEHNSIPRAGVKAINNEHQNKATPNNNIIQYNCEEQQSQSRNVINSVPGISATAGKCQFQEQLQKQSTCIVASNSQCGCENEKISYCEFELPYTQNDASNSCLKCPIAKEVLSSQHLNDRTIRIREAVQTAICEMRSAPFMCYDAAIVYDKRDYDTVLMFKNELTRLPETSDIREPIRIELFDSEHFAQSTVKVVEDVISKCGVAFIYLTKHTNTTFINYFCAEAIATTEFPEINSFNDPMGYKRCIIKPVHTSPSSSRTYKTPTGLTSFTSINWYDRKSGFTQEQLVALLKDAIVKRKRKEIEENTRRSFAFMVSMKT